MNYIHRLVVQGLHINSHEWEPLIKQLKKHSNKYLDYYFTNQYSGLNRYYTFGKNDSIKYYIMGAGYIGYYKKYSTEWKTALLDICKKIIMDDSENE